MKTFRGDYAIYFNFNELNAELGQKQLFQSGLPSVLFAPIADTLDASYPSQRFTNGVLKALRQIIQGAFSAGLNGCLSRADTQSATKW